MKRIILISICLLAGLTAIYCQRVEILKLNTNTITIGNEPNVKKYGTHGVFYANETIHWNGEEQGMMIKFLDGQYKSHITTVTKENFQTCNVNNVAKYMKRKPQNSSRFYQTNHGSNRDLDEDAESPDSAVPEKRFALVIGNSNYEHLKRLDNPKNDVDSVTDKLCSLDFDVLPAYDADYKQFNNLINILSEKKDYDVVLVYYSGHGIRHNNKQYLIPIDAEIKDPSDLENNCFTLYQLYTNLGILKEAKARIVFIDACRTETPWQKEGDSEEEAEQDNPIAVIYSTSKNKKAFDGKSGGNSPFAKAFIQEIGNPSESFAKTIGNINEILQQNTNGIQSVSDHGSAIITKFTFVAVEKEGISLKTDQDELTRVVEGYIKSEDVGYSAEIEDFYDRTDAVEIFNSVTAIQDYGFRDCAGIGCIFIPASVTSIGKGVFAGCNELWGITVDPDNPKYDSRDGCNAIIETATNTLIAGCHATEIPETVTSIGPHAFEDCMNPYLYNDSFDIETPKSVTTIGDCAFKNNSKLISIILPNTIKSIGKYAFQGCTSLKSINIPSSLTSIEEGTFKDCTKLYNIEIPNTIKSIGEYAFQSCTSLKSINIHSPLTSISDKAFSGCTELASLSIPESVTIIGYEVFEDTPWFNSQPEGLLYIGRVAYKYIGEMPERSAIIIKDGTTSIGNSAFEYCEGLTSVTIPNSVTSIGDFAFYGCTKLTSIAIPESVTNIGYSVFEDTPWFNSQPKGLLYLGHVAYKYIGEMPERSAIIIKEGTTSIGNHAFEDCDGLTSVTIPNTVTSIGSSAFSGCTKLTDIIIPNSVTSIGSDAFSDCSIKNFYIKKETPPKYYQIFGEKVHYRLPDTGSNLHVPKGCKKSYEKVKPWCYFDNIIDDL